MLVKNYQIAVLDDYQDVALESADWSVLRDRADIAAFHNHHSLDARVFGRRLMEFGSDVDQDE